jgi:SWI/SNF related-matrix-associated actin-dependent regulator of chromatin subfamily C
VEQQAFPEFFVRGGHNRSFTPQLYKQYRDTIINLYRAKPSRRLLSTEVRARLAGDFNILTA